MRKEILVFLAVFQSVLLSAHFFVYETWVYFWEPVGTARSAAANAVVFLIAVSFVVASLLSFKYWNRVTRTVYRAAAIWLGLFNFLFLASAGKWISKIITIAPGLPLNKRPEIGKRVAIAGRGGP